METFAVWFALVQISGALFIITAIRRKRESRVRNGEALKGWIRRGDVYASLGIRRFGL